MACFAPLVARNEPVPRAVAHRAHRSRSGLLSRSGEASNEPVRRLDAFRPSALQREWCEQVERSQRPMPIQPWPPTHALAPDPAERQADAIGTRIGGELEATTSLSPGPLPQHVRAVAERHLGI